MRLDLIERKVIRAVGVTLAVVALVWVGLAMWGRYRVFSEQKELEQRRQYEQEMARYMEQERLVEGMSRGVVRATLGPPDSTFGKGELAETWYYFRTQNYGEVMLWFERNQLVRVERVQENPQPPLDSSHPETPDGN